MDLNTFIAQPERFKEMTIEDQLSVVADLKLLCDDMETTALEAGRKFEAKHWKDRAEYWKSTGQNIKKLIELDVVNKRMGL